MPREAKVMVEADCMEGEEGGTDEFLFVSEDKSAVDLLQPSCGRRERGSQHGGGVLGADDVYFFIELEQQASGDWLTEGGIVVWVLGAEVIYVIPEMEQQAGGDVSDAKQHLGGFLFLDSKEQVGGGVHDMKQQPDNGLFVDLED
ncbi:hypothetical protein E2562_015230 [Oryza meyeriana var. granulata]|uniref:Uncharacterized protein n=1 Tax=Oryza meyeriana var. granulata TaxID=110450 RepID=A0A6G1EX40_9ORYZ|nr:hypothetical protein E2562_015230 [Oryza meyeriana var. granulata]